MDVVVLFGAPGSGKGTQTQLLVDEFKFRRISTGDIIRGEIKEGSVLGKLTQDFQSRGELVPDELVDEMVGKLLSSGQFDHGLVFDGYPRTRGQARALDRMLGSLPIVSNVFVLYFDVSLAAVSARISSRISCTACAAVFSREMHRFESGSACPNCGGTLAVRLDDASDVVAARFAVFEKELGPIIDYYSDRIIRVDAEGSTSDVYEQIRRIINRSV